MLVPNRLDSGGKHVLLVGVVVASLRLSSFVLCQGGAKECCTDWRFTQMPEHVERHALDPYGQRNALGGWMVTAAEAFRRNAAIASPPSSHQQLRKKGKKTTVIASQYLLTLISTTRSSLSISKLYSMNSGNMIPVPRWKVLSNKSCSQAAAVAQQRKVRRKGLGLVPESTNILMSFGEPACAVEAMKNETARARI